MAQKNILINTLFLFVCILFISNCTTDFECGTEFFNCVNGDCMKTDSGNLVCNCLPGFSGDACDLDECDACDGRTCLTDDNGDLILDENGTVICLCTQCGPRGFCQVDDNGVALLDSLGNLVCECDEGFFGDSCQFAAPCAGTNCPENSICVDDQCICDWGYTGSDCATETRSKYFGTYSAVSQCETGSEISYTCMISTNELRLVNFSFSNFGDQGDGIYGTIKDEDTFVIPLQANSAGNVIRSINTGHFSVSGNLTEINIRYNISESGNSINCEMTLTKQ